MEQDNLISYSNVRRRVQRLFRLKKPLTEHLRGALAGALISFAMAENIAYHGLRASVLAGDQPWYTIDVVIVAVSLLEAVASPTIAVLGQRRRRLMLMVGIVVTGILMLVALAVPGIDTVVGTDLCGGPIYPRIAGSGVSWTSWLRLLMLLTLAASTAVARSVLWTHGLAYLDEHEPDSLMMNFGIFTAMRILGLVAIPRAISHNTMGVAVAGAAAPLLLHITQMFLVPVRPPATARTIPIDERLLGVSCLRGVCQSSEVLWQMLNLMLLAAAVWGFGYHQAEIIKTQFLVSRPDNGFSGQASVLQCLVLVLVVVLVAKYNVPETETALFNKASAAKLATVMTFLMIPIFVIMVTVPSCDQGIVTTRSEVNCTICKCQAPWLEFNPVCVSNKMTTFYSPCHAGCVRQQITGGILSYKDCACTDPGYGVERATRGACGAAQCQPPLLLFDTLYLLILVLSVAAFQCLGASIVRLVDGHDRSAALGATIGAIALGAFALGHVLFRTAAVSTCAWSQGGRCNLQSPLFPYIVGAMSGGLTLLSTVISMVTWFRLKSKKPPLEVVIAS